MERKREYSNTYCNPLPIPDISQGCNVDGVQNYRDVADPTVILYEGKWYLYASSGCSCYSDDFRTWKTLDRMEIPVLSAPTVVKHNGKIYLMGSNSPIYEADDPWGPFRELGMIRDGNGKVLCVRDPMLFADEDGRLYLYWGLGPDGIYGMELRTDCPIEGIGSPVSLIQFQEEHEWERLGAWNQNRGMSFIEGAWMHKHNGAYYLIYSASGTCYRTYAWGAYRSGHPLGGFVYQKRNPVLRKKRGLVSGTGHGSVVEGPGGTLWAFYTIKMCYAAKYERRIAMDPAGFDENGDFFVRKPSEIPQWSPGVVLSPEDGNATPLLPLTSEEQAYATSCVPGHEALYALDESMLTWWQPEEKEVRSSLTVDLRAVFLISAVRLIFRDVGLDYENGIGPGPFGYLLEGCIDKEGEQFETLLDCSGNRTDYSVDYRTFEEREVRCVRLTITSRPPGICPGVISFTVFGTFLES